MKTKIKKEDITRGYELIKGCIDHVLERDSHLIQYEVSSEAPHTYKAMRASKDALGYYLVYDGGDHGYLGEEYNIKFRAIHDHMHYENELSFKFDHERTLSKLTAVEFFSIAYHQLGATHFEAWSVKKIIETEIGGQIDYYEKHGKFVSDQKQFIDEALLSA